MKCFFIFQDPSVQQAVQSGPTGPGGAATGAPTANLDDYNPFDGQQKTTPAANSDGKAPPGRRRLTLATILKKPTRNTVKKPYQILLESIWSQGGWASYEDFAAGFKLLLSNMFMSLIY